MTNTPDFVTTPSTVLVGKPHTALWKRWQLWTGLAFILLAYSQYKPTQPMIITGDAAGTYKLQVYETHLFYWVDLQGSRGVDTSFRVVYYSHQHDPARMREEAHKIAPALFPFADSAGLRLIELKPSRPLFLEPFPLAIISYDVKYERQRDGTWKATSG